MWFSMRQTLRTISCTRRTAWMPPLLESERETTATVPRPTPASMVSRCPGTGWSGSRRCRRVWEATRLWTWRECAAVEVVPVDSLRELAVPQRRSQMNGPLNLKRQEVRAGLAMCPQRLPRLACPALHCWVVLGLLYAASPLDCLQRRHSRSLIFRLLWLVLLPLRQRDQCRRLHDPLAWLRAGLPARRHSVEAGSK